MSTQSAQVISLKNVEVASVIFALLFLIGGLILKPSVPVLLGLGAGGFLSIINFRLLRRVVVKMLDAASDGRKTSGMGRFLIKMILLIALVVLLLVYVSVDPIAFTIGFSSIVLGILVVGIRSIF